MLFKHHLCPEEAPMEAERNRYGSQDGCEDEKRCKVRQQESYLKRRGSAHRSMDVDVNRETFK